jgi:Effector protein
MPIYKQGQCGTAGRVASRAARWISFFALVIMTVAQSPSRADLGCLGSPEFVAACNAAIEEIRNSTPNGRAEIEQLENSSNVHIIDECTTTHCDNSDAVDFRTAYDLESCLRLGEQEADCIAAGAGSGSGTFVEWNPNDSSPFASDGVEADPTATLLHELYHSSLADEGGWSNDIVPGTRIDHTEIDATLVENVYRDTQEDLELRTMYDDARIPPIHGVPETGSSILMLLIGIGALWCFGVFYARRNTRPRIVFALSPKVRRASLLPERGG